MNHNPDHEMNSCSTSSKPESEKFNLDDIRATCSNLTPAQHRKVLRILSYNPDEVDDSTEMGYGETMFIWLADLLQLAPIDPEFRWLAIKEAAVHVKSFGEYLERALEGRDPDTPKGKLPEAFVGFGDGSHMAITGHDQLLDLESGEWVSGVKTKFVTLLQYNLTRMFMIYKIAYSKNHKNENSHPRLQ